MRINLFATLICLFMATTVAAQCNTFDCAYNEAQRLLNSSEKDKFSKAMSYMDDAENFAGSDTVKKDKIATLRKWAFKIYKRYDELALRVKNDSSRTYMLLFWSTWDKLSANNVDLFNVLNSRIDTSKVKIILVSLDFESQLKNLVSFFKAHPLSTEVVLLTDQDANTWLPQVSEKWDGTVPFSVFIKPNGKKVFFEGQFLNYSELFEWYKSNSSFTKDSPK